MSSSASTLLAGLVLGLAMVIAYFVAKFFLKSGPAMRAATLAILGAACGTGAAILALALAFGFGVVPLQGWPAWASMLCLALGALLGAAPAALGFMMLNRKASWKP